MPGNLARILRNDDAYLRSCLETPSEQENDRGNADGDATTKPIRN